MSELGIGDSFIWVFISMHTNKAIVKVLISTEIGICVQGPTYEVWNSPCILKGGKDYIRAMAINVFVQMKRFSSMHHWSCN